MKKNQMNNIPLMPEEFKSGIKFFVKYNGTMATKWTDEEEAWCWDLFKQGYKYSEIAYSIGREEQATRTKMKRLKKRYNIYNDKHRDDKYATNDMYLEYMTNKYTINNILDVFCGYEMFYSKRGFNSINNDINKEINCDYNLSASKLLKMMIKENKKFSIVDLDAFGATITYLEDALLLAENGLVMTLGELGHKRWKRLDFISKHYNNIKSVEDITVDNFIDEIIKIASLNEVKLRVIHSKDWTNIGRVWFEIIK